jgi:hypothetical protein
MRIIMRTAAIALFVLVANARALATRPPDADLSGWGRTKWGMTKQEVLAVLPEGARPARNGETGDLVLEDVPFGGGLYEARLFIGPHGLERVFLSAAKQAATPALRRRLERALTAELGGGSFASRRPEETDLRWIFPSTEVRLLYSRLSTPGVNWQGLFVVFSRGSGRRPWPDSFQAESR